MKQPFWKYILSYIHPFTIEVVEGQYNPYLEVVYSQGRYRLDTENAIYSYQDLYTNYLYSFKQIDLEKLPGKDVLILGFGLGSIPYMLEEVFGKEYNYTAIEIDEEVIGLAHKYTMSSLNSNIEYVCADAGLFVAQCERKFDLICMDVFMDDLVPLEFEATGFLYKLKQLIKADGLLLYNRLFNSPNDKVLTRRFFENNFKQVFEDGTYLNVDGNWMLLNRKP